MIRKRTAEDRNLTPVEARQGFLDKPVLLVLIASVAMVSVIFALLLLGY